MSRIFVISDTHFGHKNILEYEAAARPFRTIEEHDEAIVERWNSVVKSGDIVYHLGDVAFGKQALKNVARLNGTKHLILGNHDSLPIQKYLDVFDSVHGSVILNKHVLTHIPVHPSQFRSRFRANIHGHLHSKTLEDERYVNVSAEHHNLTPVRIDKLYLKEIV